MRGDNKKKIMEIIIFCAFDIVLHSKVQVYFKLYSVDISTIFKIYNIDV